jgi:uncharacterized protein involved in exopolysaccharide biosynthesis/Mrp family chromosome partitioning ATPase
MVSPSLKRYLLALDRYKWAALTSFLGGLGIAAGVALQPPPSPQYRAVGTLVQNFPLVTFTVTGSEVQQRGQGIISEQFLLADVLLQEVSQELMNRGIDLPPEQIRDRTTLRVNNEDEQIQRVSVVVSGPTAEVAQTTLDLLFEGMVELSRVANRARQRAIVTALEARLPEVEAELRQAEQALESYDRLEGPAIQAALDGSLLGGISGSQQQQRQNQILLAGLDSQIQSLQRQLGMTADEAFTSSALSADPIIAQLRAQILATETQLEVLSSDLRPAHPTIQELRNSLVAYNTLLEDRAAEVIGGGDLTDLPSVDQVRQDSALDPARASLANQLVALSAERDAIQQQQRVLAQSEDDLRQQYGRLPNKQLERNRLAQQVALKQALYDQIQAKRIDAAAAEAETVSSLTIAEPPATTLRAQEGQNPGTVMAIGSVLGLLAAGAVVFLLDLLDGVARTEADLQDIFADQDVPVLGILPVLSIPSPQSGAILISPHAAGGAAYERLRTNLRLAGGRPESGRPPSLVLVTSTRDQEGKTVTAFNLGIAAARAGQRTLVVEMDLHRPSQAGLMGVHLPTGAATDPLRYYGGHRGEPVQLVPAVENLYCVPAPGPLAYPAAVIESTELEQFLAMARARFDWVILDAPDLDLSNDARVLAAKTDGMVIVARPGYTEKAGLDEALDQLLDAEDLRVLGAVINGTGGAVSISPPGPGLGFRPEPASPRVESIAASPPVEPVEF